MLKKKYKILSIGWHLCSTISYFENDEIKYVVSEERFSRIKNDCSFPILSINSLLKTFHIKIVDLDYILITSTKSPPATELIKSMSKWSVKDYLNQQSNYWYPKIYKKKNISELKVMKNWDLNNNYKKEIIKNFGFQNLDKNFLKNRKLFFSKILNFPKEKIFEIDHHTCHAYYSYYASPFRNKKVLSFVMDGNGDGKNASVGIFEKNGKYKLKYFTNHW
jgi:carbamoyltransferase